VNEKILNIELIRKYIFCDDFLTNYIIDFTLTFSHFVIFFFTLNECTTNCS